MSSNSDSRDSSPLTHQPVVPVDLVGGYHDHHRHGGSRMSNPVQSDSTPAPAPVARSSSGSSSGSSLKSPRTARFAEATTVVSPIGPSESGQSPFADPPAMAESQHHISDVGFGYVADNDASRHVSHPPLSPASPLKSALKSPGTARTLNPLSPTFREELNLEKQEKKTERENARDLKIKARVRLAKVLLRFVNFSCSLIVLSLIATTLSIFNATKALPPRNNLPPWAIGTNPWPQILLLVLASISLFTCLVVLWSYWRGGHRRAEKVAVYYSVFSVCFFIFSVVMWVVGAALFQNAKASGNGQDLWGWSCNQNTRAQLFQDDVNYSLICRLQDWSLVCAIIEVVIEVIVILIYAVIFYRFYSKERLRRTMDLRDKARSDLYLAQLRVQSAPNTPGFMPHTPKSSYMTTVMPTQDAYSAAENGENYSVQYATPKSPEKAAQKPFQLQPPPIRVHHATPKPAQEGFAPASGAAPAASDAPGPSERPSEQVNPHVGAAPGEKTYEPVPIPNAYTSPVASPSFPPPAAQAHPTSMG